MKQRRTKPTTNGQDHDILTTAEAASLLKMDKRTLAKNVKDGAIPGMKIGGLWRFSRAALFNFLKPPRLQ